MKKKILTLALVVVMIAVMLTSFTMAYFTDTDTESNVMTMGKLDIEIKEYNKDGEAFDDAAITVLPSSNAGPIADGTKLNTVNNWVDKIVKVENQETSTDAWLRSIILFEVPNSSTTYEGTDKVSENGFKWFFDKVWLYFDVNDPTDTAETTLYQLKDTVTIGNTEYAVIVCYPGDYETYSPDESYSALMGFAFDKSVTSAETDAMGETYDVLVLAQGLQADAATGKSDVATAFDTAFGKITAENVAKWFAGDDKAD